MPAYGAAGNQPTSIPPGFAYAVWNAESPASGTKSQEVTIEGPYGFSPSASIDIQFSAAPGNFTIDVQEADFDVEADYVNITAAEITQTALGPSGTACRVDMANTGFKGRFLRLKMTSQPTNVVTTTATIRNRGH